MTKEIKEIKIVSLFSGAGGLDKGFELAATSGSPIHFETVWANEYDNAIHATYRNAFPKAMLVEKSITKVAGEDLVDLQGADLIRSSNSGLEMFGLLGGPPCQSWSAAGAKRGKEDPRGQLFWDYIRILSLLKPVFFVAENVPGILADRNKEALAGILQEFCDAGYNVQYSKLNAAFHDVPEDRERVIFVGVRSDIVSKSEYSFPSPSRLEDGKPTKMTMQDVPALLALSKSARPFSTDNRSQDQNEFMEGGFSPLFMSRNRCRNWNEPSFTIQATARHAPVHPELGSMSKVGQDAFVFDKPNSVRRFTVRECAEIQTFPADHKFIYKNITDGYKMIGNAVPVNLGRAIAKSIGKYLAAAEIPAGKVGKLTPGSARFIAKPYAI